MRDASTGAAMTPTLQRLLTHLVDADVPDPALVDLPVWLTEAPRFRSFAETNRDKIRKKLRGAVSMDARLDIRAELRVAALLLADRRFELTFEAYGVGRLGPDFTATFRGGRPFNIEVTRRRIDAAGGIEPAILAKLRQLPPSASNVLVIAVDDPDGAPDPGSIMRALRSRADRRDDAYFVTKGLEDAATFNAGIRRLAAVIAWAEHADAARRIATWSNAAARIPLPEPTTRALRAAIGA